MIKLDKINKSFNQNNKILNDISFHINKGESVAIIGKSGTGKSVLLKHINGLLRPDSGNIWVDDILLNDLSFSQLQKVRKKMAMVFQFGALFDSMTVYENIEFAIESLTNSPKDKIKNNIYNSLSLVNLDGIENLKPSELSGGMKKRVGIARAIAIKPEYVLYDEPTTGLDPITSDKINSLIKKVSEKRKVTSIVVTHNMKTLKFVANKVIMLHEGDIIFDGETDELFSSNDSFIKYFVTGRNN